MIFLEMSHNCHDSFRKYQRKCHDSFRDIRETIMIFLEISEKMS